MAYVNVSMLGDQVNALETQLGIRVTDFNAVQYNVQPGSRLEAIIARLHEVNALLTTRTLLRVGEQLQSDDQAHLLALPKPDPEPVDPFDWVKTRQDRIAVGWDTRLTAYDQGNLNRAQCLAQNLMAMHQRNVVVCASNHSKNLGRIGYARTNFSGEYPHLMHVQFVPKNSCIFAGQGWNFYPIDRLRRALPHENKSFNLKHEDLLPLDTVISKPVTSMPLSPEIKFMRRVARLLAVMPEVIRMEERVKNIRFKEVNLPVKPGF